jgi:hypothetical protein
MDSFSESLFRQSFSIFALSRFPGFPLFRCAASVLPQRLGVPDSVPGGVPAVLLAEVAGER